MKSDADDIVDTPTQFATAGLVRLVRYRHDKIEFARQEFARVDFDFGAFIGQVSDHANDELVVTPEGYSCFDLTFVTTDASTFD